MLPRGHEEGGLLARELRGALLEAVDRGVLAVDVVPHLGLGHGAPHGGSGLGHRVRSQIHPALAHGVLLRRGSIRRRAPRVAGPGPAAPHYALGYLGVKGRHGRGPTPQGRGEDLPRAPLHRAPTTCCAASTLTVPRGRHLRLPRAQRRGEDHHAQDRDGPPLPRRRGDRHPRRDRRRTARCAAAIGFLPEAPYFYDYLSGLRAPGLHGTPARRARTQAGLSHPRAPARGGHGGQGARPAAQVQQGHAPAHRPGPGPAQRPRPGDPGRAHERPGPHRPAGDPRPHPLPQGAGEDGVLLLPHPRGRRDDLRPGGHPGEGPGGPGGAAGEPAREPRSGSGT